MAYTVTELITRSYNLANVVARELQVVSGTQLLDGLRLLNSLIAMKSTVNSSIPYFAKSNFASIIGTESYFIEDLNEIETLTFVLNNVRYSMRETQRVAYFGSSRVNNIQSFPYQYHFEREKGGGTIYIYFLPNQVYQFEIFGKFALSSVSLNQDLELTLDNFYIEYLRYGLAKLIAAENGVSISNDVRQQLSEYEEMLTDISPIDLSMQKSSTLGKSPLLNWGIVNLSGGWTTP